MGNHNGTLHLGNALVENTALQILNLSSNRIDDQGAKNLAEGLKLNRNLISLNLGKNEIGDAGAKDITASLTTFPLTHEQVVERRMLKYSYYNDESDDSKD